MLPHATEIIFRTFLALGVVLVLARVMGRRSVAQLTLYDYVIGLLFGNVGATFAVDRSVPVIDGVVSLLACTAWILIINFLMLKNVPARKLVDPEPVMAIYKGHILEENLRKNYYTFASILELLRERDIFNPGEVKLGVIESDGQLSIVKDDEGAGNTTSFKPEGVNDFAVHLAGRALVLNGEIIERAINHSGVSREWLINSLRQQNLALEDVMVALITPDRRLYIDLREDNLPEMFS